MLLRYDSAREGRGKRDGGELKAVEGSSLHFPSSVRLWPGAGGQTAAQGTAATA